MRHSVSHSNYNKSIQVLLWFYLNRRNTQDHSDDKILVTQMSHCEQNSA